MKENAFITFDNAEQENLDSANIALPAAADVLSPRSYISPRETLDFQLKTSGKNKLLELSTPLLGLSVRIRNMGSYANVDELHSRLTNELANFQQEVTALGYDDATTLAARYCLCSMIDESVLSQPWGAESAWPERPMLSTFHNETWGGEKVFSILDRVLDEAHRFMDLLELIYFCISLGFEGKYHVMHNGQARLDALLYTVYQVLQKHSGEAPDTLLDPNPNIYYSRQKMNLRFPIWLVGVGAIGLLVGIHLFFDIRLTQKIQDIGQDIHTTLGFTEGDDA